MQTDDLDFILPPDLIAQTPLETRSASRLMHYRMADHSIDHRRFEDLPCLLRKGDLLVLNDAQVIPARFTLRKSTGGRVEGLFLGEPAPGHWDVLLKNMGPARSGMVFRFEKDDSIQAHLAEAVGGGGEHRLILNRTEPALILLGQIGRMPLPPYIKRQKEEDQRDELDRRRYQTVYARHAGAVAAPTAGLHFTEDLLGRLETAGVERTFITLHVGLGTFKPVTAGRLEDHAMHIESYCIPPDAADALNRAKAGRRRIVAVGTTCARVLESCPVDRSFEARCAETGIFIHPPYRWKHVDALITNFHLPRSTLIALVAAMTGLEEQRRLYRAAITGRYRFFSYGDAMLIE